MFSNNNEHSAKPQTILLLQPLPQPPRKKIPSNCAIGGLPTFYPNDEKNDHRALPTCDKCHSSLFLLIQLFAPIDGLDRTLYVFGCNQPSCQTYRCLRSQSKVNADKKTTATVKENHIEDEAPRVTTKSLDGIGGGWGIDGDGDDWGGDNGDWGDLNDDGDDAMDDIEAMLAAAELKQEQEADKSPENKNSKKKKKKVKKKPNHVASSGQTNKTMNSDKCFPCFELELFDEPEGRRRGAMTDDMDSDDDGDSVTDYDDDNIQRLLKNYLTEETDEDILSALKNKKNAHRSGGGRGKGGGGGNGEAYERLPLDQRMFMTFTNRIRRAPKQISRYAYGGEPLWPSPWGDPDTASQSSHLKLLPPVPRCSCGAKREFEFQLMPSLLHVLNVDQCSGQPLRQGNGSYKIGGMDWGVIAVYSCEDSCEKSFEEFVIVQDPVDSEPVKRVPRETTPDDNDDFCDVSNQGKW